MRSKAHCNSCGNEIGPGHNEYCLSYQQGQSEVNTKIIPIFLVVCVILTILAVIFLR